MLCSKGSQRPTPDILFLVCFYLLHCLEFTQNLGRYLITSNLKNPYILFSIVSAVFLGIVGNFALRFIKKPLYLVIRLSASSREILKLAPFPPSLT